MRIFSTLKAHKKKIIAILLVTGLMMLVAQLIVANKIAPISWGWWGDINSTEGVAIEGYDPVAYHAVNIPLKGDASISYSWKGVNWHFITDEYRSMFMAEPEKYAPQYGGYCAYAVSKGVTAKASPESWVIQQGKLYLLNDDQVKTSWINGEISGINDVADANWSMR